MNYKNVMGYVILILLFLGIYITIGVISTFVVATVVFFGAVAGTVIVCIAIYLIED